MGLYLLTMPERLFRSLVVLVAGLLYELSRLLPSSIRRSHLYQAVVARGLRILMELVGGAVGVMPPDPIDVRELTARKAAGNVLEVASVMLVGWSPLWLLAATADLTSGTKAYLEAFGRELRDRGVIGPTAAMGSAAELLEALHDTSGLFADAIDVPPLNASDLRLSLADMQNSLTTLKDNVGHLPGPREQAALYEEMRAVAGSQGQSLWAVSGAIAAGAVRAGVRMGSVHVYDYYRRALAEIATHGFAPYVQRQARPYSLAIRCHLDPAHATHTELALRRAWGWVRR